MKGEGDQDAHVEMGRDIGTTKTQTGAHAERRLGPRVGPRRT